MGLFKRKEVPAVAIDGVRRTEPLPKFEPQSQIEVIKEQVSYKPLSVVTSQGSVSTVGQEAEKIFSVKNEDGYFKNLVKNITEKTEDLDKLSAWYKNKFMPGDVVFQMREYWQKRQPEILLKDINGDLKNKLMERTERLHSLEKEWQEIYFNLLGKEEEIRREEKDLKNSLSEFIDTLKGSAGKKSRN